MRTLLLMSVLTLPSFSTPAARLFPAPDGLAEKSRKGGHPDGGKKKDEEEEEDCRFAKQDPELPRFSALS